MQRRAPDAACKKQGSKMRALPLPCPLQGTHLRRKSSFTSYLQYFPQWGRRFMGLSLQNLLYRVTSTLLICVSAKSH